MVLSVNLRKTVHRKSPEYLAFPPQGNTGNGSFICSDKSDVIPNREQTFLVYGSSAMMNYVPDEDSFLYLPASAIAGTFGAGSCGTFRALAAPAGNITTTAAAGGTTTKCNTSLNIKQNAVGKRFRIVSGSGVGLDTTIKNITLGANAVIELNSPASVPMDATTQFQIYSGSLWVFNAGTGAIGFAVYDILTGAWTQRSVTGLPTTWGTDAQLVKTPSASSSLGDGFVNGTATSGTSTTLVDTSKTWTNFNWANMQVRINSGTGAGQIRKISSSSSNTLTVSVAWTVTPDATSVYVIEGDDDAFFLFGNNAVTGYKFSISANAWSTLAPAAARSGAYAAGGTADWIDGVAEWAEGQPFSGEFHYQNLIRKQNGRYIYSFRGGGTSTLDIYDICANTWVSGVTYGNQNDAFGGGSCSSDIAGIIYLTKDATGRYYKFDVNVNRLSPLFQSPIPQGAAVAGNKITIVTFKEGSQTLTYIYTLSNTSNYFVRYLLV